MLSQPKHIIIINICPEIRQIYKNRVHANLLYRKNIGLNKKKVRIIQVFFDILMPLKATFNARFCLER